MRSEDNFYDHYKDSWALQQSYLSERNKLTVTLIVLLVLVAGFMYEPAMLPDKVNTYLDSRVKGLAFGMKYLNTGLIYLLLWVLTRYYQIVNKIDRLYEYIHKCEKTLRKAGGEYNVNRDGEYFYDNKSWLTIALNLCYGIVLPLAIILIAGFKIYNEIGWTTRFKYVDIVGLGFIIIFSLLYLSRVLLLEESIKEKYSRKDWWCHFKEHFFENQKNKEEEQEGKKNEKNEKNETPSAKQ